MVICAVSISLRAVDDMHKLIEEVRKRPCLYNCRREDYRDAAKKARSWRDIACILNRNCSEIKAEWKKMRDCFRAALYRRKNKSADYKVSRPWLYESRMQFLVPFLYSRPNKHVLDDGMSTDSITIIDVRGPDTVLDGREDTIADVPGQDTVDSVNIEEATAEQPEDTDKDVNRSFCFPKSRKRRQTDDLDYFFASACESTRNLPRLQQIKIKREILNLISGIEEEHLLLFGNSNTNISPQRPPSSCSTSNSEIFSLFHQDFPLPSTSNSHPFQQPNDVKIEMVEPGSD